MQAPPLGFDLVNLLKIVCLLALNTAVSSAQTFELLHSFGSLTNQAGTAPVAPPTLGPDGVLYGATSAANKGGIVRGAIYRVRSDGTEFIVLKQFTNVLDGAAPRKTLLLSTNTLFGIASEAGAKGGGTLFRIDKPSCAPNWKADSP